MKSPLEGGARWLVLDEVGSTQDVAADLLRQGDDYGIVLAEDQKTGRGRMSREWVSSPGDSLTMSLIFRAYPNHPQPHLIGMSVALAAANTVESNLQWPNDLTIDKKKVGGILTELKPDQNGDLIAVVGLGINLNQAAFPHPIAHRAISLFQVHGCPFDWKTVAESVVQNLSNVPEPNSWSNLVPAWSGLDDTPGKTYQTPGGQTVTAVGIGSNGELIASVDGKSVSVLAADAIFAQTSRP